ncbi:MAG: type VI secretion system protein TssA [Rhodosalinus sp.]|uniref:type VI secretion system protein TssA n=1 Tax=Rhodosalinus sp. TaxID=2047741 RepID=UPI00397E7943
MDEFFKTHGEDAPSGPNLEYEPVFAEMEIAAQPGEERQMGNAVIEAEDPDYRTVAAKAREVLDLSHDLRAAVYLAQAELSTDGLGGFADVLGYIRYCLEEHWETCHPQLDAEDDDDPTMRVNAVLGLAGADTVIRALRRAPLTQSPAFGRFTLRDIEVAEGEIEPREGEASPDAASIGAAIQDTPEEMRAAIAEAARRALDHAQAIDAVFQTRLPGEGPELAPLLRTLGKIVVHVGATSASGEPDAEEGDGDGVAEAEGPRAGHGGVPGRLESQRDVLAALDAITDYYARREPSSPVPLLMKRARRLVGADFLTIIDDMAPAGRDNVTLVGGIAETESDD